MRNLILSATLAALLTAPAMAATYPVSGRWGQSASSTQGAIDCSGKRVVSFDGNQRTDSGGSVRAFQNRSVTRRTGPRNIALSTYSATARSAPATPAIRCAWSMTITSSCKCSRAAR